MSNDTIDFDFAPAIARCLAFPDEPPQALVDLVRDDVLNGPDDPDRATLRTIQDKIDATPYATNHIALVYGGATKIKGYVFEAPKLPEIRGASALLDWVNEVELPKLWGANSPIEFIEKGIIYASGGSILAFAPVSKGQELATAIEHTYTNDTLAANSVAVCEEFSLLELRYGRKPMAYWLEDFEKDWTDESEQAAHKQVALKHYYYLPQDIDVDAANAIQQRFLNRKTFGELVTLLATMANRRREERAAHGDTRSIPFYSMMPWAEKCESSDVRPIVVTTLVGTDRRALSEASARKLIAGRIAKGNVYRITDLENDLEWQVPSDLISWGRHMSWERRWETYINGEGRDSFCGRKKGTWDNPRPAKDVHEIGAASNGYIGIIYADGNNVGRLIATLTTPDRYASTSKALSNAARLAVFKALAAYIEPMPSLPDDNARPLLYPFEILAIGGDDLFLIVPGDKALDIALAIGRNFEQQLAEDENLIKLANKERFSTDTMRGRYSADTMFLDANYKPSIGLSAGVVVAQETAPIFFLRGLVEELLDSAKDLAKENAKHGFYGGAVDFMVMKSITMVTDKIKSFRRQALGDEEERRLTARPYTWHEFAGLLDTVRGLKKARVPRSQLYRLRRVLDAEPGNAITPSVMEYLYTRTRLSKAYSEALQRYIEQSWCWQTPLTKRVSGLPPWMPLDASRWETIWPDMLEAYEMVPVEEQQ